MTTKTFAKMNIETQQTLDIMQTKYEQLIWYARKAPSDHPSYWEAVPQEIKEGALNAMSMVEEYYPDECDQLSSESGDFHHGFNSGALAVLRFIETAMSEGITAAHESFPDLDT